VSTVGTGQYYIRRNGAQVAGPFTPTANEEAANLSPTIAVSAGDYLEIECATAALGESFVVLLITSNP
jgi:hypothetical protein